ncbi:MAG: 16S rRNA (cytosine(1402)-N(4))-methyltransferase RsmH [Actinobacteria bacterium]|nr:16S rRNA (cytosine(1402)-N(4))-methyltransferase RsmH [Actinomycetota bacterium]
MSQANANHPDPNAGTGPDLPGQGRHQPVMVGEVVSILSPVPAGIMVDATVGDGGHAAAMLEANTRLFLLGLDRDPAAIVSASRRLERYRDRVALEQLSFDQLAVAACPLAAAKGLPVTAVLFDLGVRSDQLDDAQRGFSYRHDGPLDMRMDSTQALTAADVVNGWSESELASLFAANGEGRFCHRLARAVVAARPLSSTTELAQVVASALPASVRREPGHPARRVFQAVRVAVNSELEMLRPALGEALSLLAPGGRCVVLSYHSGEDRIVKAVFKEAETGGCSCPPKLPCHCGAQRRARLLFRSSRRPSALEVESNPRASSARMRALERLGANESRLGS